MATVINHNLPVKQANILVKKAIASKFAVLSEKDNVLKVGAPMMTATIKITDKTIEIDNNGPAGKIVANTCASAIQMEVDQLESAPQPQASAASDMDEKLKAAQLLKSYKDLLDAGVLTQEEFDDKKEELLEKLNGGSSESDSKPKKRDIYKEALAAKNNGDYEKAIELFESTNGYSDSEQQVIQCDELLNKKNYDNAVSIKNGGDYGRAIDEFKKLNGYADSNEQIAECGELSTKRDYDNAVSIKNSGDYTKAIEEFQKLNGYADSNEQIAQCTDALNKRDYDYAVSLKNDGKFNDAIAAFNKLNGYADSERLIEECRSAIALKEKESVYDSCVTDISEIKSGEEYEKINGLIQKLQTISDYEKAADLLSKYREMTESYKEAEYQNAAHFFEEEKYGDSIQLFKILGDYKDSQDKLKLAIGNNEIHCRYQRAVAADGCNNIREYDNAVSELKTIRDYKDSAQYIEKYENALKKLKGKRNKAIIISGSAAAAAVLVVVLTLTVFVPLSRQNRIVSLIDSHDYDSASALIEKNGNFGKSRQYERMCEAGDNFEKGLYELGISCVTSVGGSVDVKYDANGGETSKTSETIRSRKHNLHVNNTPTKTGYTFFDWKQSDYSISCKDLYASVSLSAEYKPVYYSIKYNLNGGVADLRNPNEYTIEDSFELYPASKTGYTFTGWKTDSDTIINSIEKGTYGNLNLTAMYSVNAYRVSIVNEDETKGTVTGSGTYEYGSSVTVTATANAGYSFAGWYSGSSKVSSSASYTFTMSADDYSLTAKWSTNTYKLTISNDSVMGTVTGSGSYLYGSSVSVTASPKQGYSFAGWYNGSSKVSADASYTFAMPAYDYALTAKWSTNAYKLSAISEDESKGTVTGSGTYEYGSSVTVTATANAGYSFAGWYDGSSKVSSDSSYTFTMPANDYSLMANWSTNSYELTVSSGNESKGSVTGSGTYEYGSSVTVTAAANTGYSFAGWYNGSSKFSADASYTFAMPAYDYALTAKWSTNAYKLSAISEDESKGTVTGSGTYEYGSSVTVTATPNEGYSFAGWYNGSTKKSSDASYTFNMPASDYSLTAKWSTNSYTLTIDNNSAKGTVTGSGTYEYGSSVTVTAIPNAESTFIGWYDSSDALVSSDSSYAFTMPAHNVELFTKYSTNSYELTVSSEDESKGTVTGSGTYEYGSSVTVTATPNDDCIFKGWYHDSTKVSDDASYTFTIPANDYSLVAHFITKAEEEEELRDLGVIPTLSGDGKTITYGLYPQTNVSDSSLISSLDSLTTPESNGWYLYEGEYYAKLSAAPDSTNYKFNNGTTIVKGTTYWFKCEPIVWNVLSNNSGEYYIVSSVLLDACCYYNSISTRTIDDKTVYPNNYKYSDIHTWLNEDFYNSAFALGNEYIQTTTVDNSAATTDSTSNSYASTNTEDKIFLPSYQDYENSNYGFSTLASKYCKTTDWARARGACYDTDSSYQYNGLYLTRSPYSGDFKYAWYVSNVGTFGCIKVGVTNRSVRPAISIKIA